MTTEFLKQIFSNPSLRLKLKRDQSNDFSEFRAWRMLKDGKFMFLIWSDDILKDQN